MSKANEFFDAADHRGEEMPNAAGDLYVDASIAASGVLCCLRLGVHSNTGNHSEAIALLKRAGNGSEPHLNTLLNVKNKAAYTHQDLTSAELKKMNRAAEHLVEAAKQAIATRGVARRLPGSSTPTVAHVQRRVLTGSTTSPNPTCATDEKRPC